MFPFTYYSLLHNTIPTYLWTVEWWAIEFLNKCLSELVKINLMRRKSQNKTIFLFCIFFVNDE